MRFGLIKTLIHILILETVNKKLLTLPIRFFLSIFIIGSLFKVMRWPYGNQLISISGIIIFTLYVIRFITKKEKSKLDFVKLGIVSIIIFSKYLYMFLDGFGLGNLRDIVLIALVIWWLIEEGPAYYMNRNFKKPAFLKITFFVILILTILLILFGILFKIQHWPYGNILFSFGMLLLSLLVIIDYFVIKRV